MKYYIKTGDCKTIITANSPISAAQKALTLTDQNNPDAQYAELIKISQIGYKNHKTDTYLSTETIMKKLGWKTTN